MRNRLKIKPDRTKLENRLLRQLENLPKYTYQQLRELDKTTLEKLLNKVDALKETLHDYQSRGKRSINRQKLTEAFENLSRLSRTIDKICRKKPLFKPYRKPHYNLRAHQQHNGVLRNQFFMKRGRNPGHKSHSLHIRIPIQVIKNKVKTSRSEVEHITKPVAEKSRIEAAGTILQILSRLLIALSLKRALPSLKAKKGKKAVRSEIEKALKELNSNSTLTRFAANTKVQAQPQSRKEAKGKAKATLSIESQKSSGSGKIIYKTILDGKGNIIGIEIVGKIEKPVETARNAVNRAPAKMIPILTEASVEAVRNDPNATFKVLDFVSKTLSKADPTTRVPVKLSAPHAMEVILGEVVHTLLTMPESSLGISNKHLTAQTKQGIVADVLARYPGAALPVLLSEYNRVPATGKQVLENLSLKIAQTKPVQEQIVQALGNGSAAQVITSTKLGKNVVVQTANNLIRQAKGSKTILGRIVSSVVLENSAKLSAKGMTFETARDFITMVSNLREYRNLAKSRNPKARANNKKIDYFARASYARNLKAKRKPKPQFSVKEARRLETLARRIDQIARTSNLIIPKPLHNRVREHAAGVANVTRPAPVQNAPISGSHLQPEHSATRSMESIVNALEVEKARLGPVEAIKSATESTAKTVISGNKILASILERLVRDPSSTDGEIRAKVAEYVKELKKSKLRYNEVIAALEGVDPQGAEATVPIYDVDALLRFKRDRKQDNRAEREEAEIVA
ncbi:MAG: hypothetical protein U9R38_00230 [Candidatus Margulisiibacteriota bacterium]|nr:hypothetical protein [Candidatus Margulisiibacteriota bacterium]